MISHLKLVRRAYTVRGTFGHLYYVDEWGMVHPICHTLELPWNFNKRNVSCIPEGSYAFVRRPSGLVARITNSEQVESFEVFLKGRTNIIVHPGNTTDETEGCILTGTALGVVNGKWAVCNSRTAYNSFVYVMKGTDETILDVSFSKF